MAIPLEERAHVIVTYNLRFIETLSDIPPGTEKVYYRAFALRTPAWMSAEDVALRLAEAEDRDIVERLELTPVYQFTSDAEDAMEFTHEKVYQEADSLTSRLGITFVVESFDREWLPFQFFINKLFLNFFLL